MKIQVKTQKVLNLLESLKNRLNYPQYLKVSSRDRSLVLSYVFCERRTTKYEMAENYYREVNKFIEIMNDSKLTLQKPRLIELKDYEDDDEYDEYEVEFGRTFYIENISQSQYIEKIFKGEKL